MMKKNRIFIQNVFSIKLVRQFHCGSVLNSDNDNDTKKILMVDLNDDDIKLSDEEKDKLLSSVNELILLRNNNKEEFYKTQNDSFDVFNSGLSNEDIPYPSPTPKGRGKATFPFQVAKNPKATPLPLTLPPPLGRGGKGEGRGGG